MLNLKIIIGAFGPEGSPIMRRHADEGARS
jgi:hypothetical protein